MVGVAQSAKGPCQCDGMLEKVVNRNGRKGIAAKLCTAKRRAHWYILWMNMRHATGTLVVCYLSFTHLASSLSMLESKPGCASHGPHGKKKLQISLEQRWAEWCCIKALRRQSILGPRSELFRYAWCTCNRSSQRHRRERSDLFWQVFGAGSGYRVEKGAALGVAVEAVVILANAWSQPFENIYKFMSLPLLCSALHPSCEECVCGWGLWGDLTWATLKLRCSHSIASCANSRSCTSPNENIIKSTRNALNPWKQSQILAFRDHMHSASLRICMSRCCFQGILRAWQHCLSDVEVNS